ncbi:hypothetical protein EDD85DRAFT_940287 [Armillaria nabsnona]|nr:hypothetical protein EDD85DRAFT_940287 [Armillaria nabsnona]
MTARTRLRRSHRRKSTPDAHLTSRERHSGQTFYMVHLIIPELNAEHGFDLARDSADVCEYLGWPLLEILDSSTGATGGITEETQAGEAPAIETRMVSVVQHNISTQALIIISIAIGIQAQDSATFQPLVAKRLEAFTSSNGLLIQQIPTANSSYSSRRLGHLHSLNTKDGKLPWTPALEKRLEAAVQDIQLGIVTNWFKHVKDSMNTAQPHLDN